MIISPGFVGIDISKDHLDIFDGRHGAVRRLDNRADVLLVPIAEWAADGSHVLFEATGSYDVVLRRALAAAGVPFCRVNPAQARAFARATGTLAKTDAIDARLLATMAQCLKPKPQEPCIPQREKLAALKRRRDQLVAARTQETLRRQIAEQADILADLEDHIADLDRRIATFDSAIKTLLDDTPELEKAARLLRSVPGIGPIVAATLLAAMPELGQRSPKTIAALAGLAPFNRDSGKLRGQRSISGGRTQVRRALYLAAVAVIRSRHRFAALYKAMIAAAKAPKVALIAIARKILVVANAVLRDQVPFRP
jgi:transposase